MAAQENNAVRDGVTTFPFAEGRANASPGGEAAPKSPSRMPVKASIALRMLREELSGLPHAEKSALAHVERVRPELVNESHLLGFLRAEEFDVGLAAKRLVRYWEQRYKVFGAEKFALPMTLDGAMKDSVDALKFGYISLLPMVDQSGRSVILFDSSLLVDLNPEVEESVLKKAIQIWWYFMHVVVEFSKKRGFVVVSNARDESHRNISLRWKFAIHCAFGDQIFPIRCQMSHVIAPPLRRVFESSLKAVLSKAQRDSFAIHDGSQEEVLRSLATFGFPREFLPTSLGGTLLVSVDAFIEERLIIEGNGMRSGKKRAASELRKSSSILELLKNQGVIRGGQINNADGECSSSSVCNAPTNSPSLVSISSQTSSGNNNLVHKKPTREKNDGPACTLGPKYVDRYIELPKGPLKMIIYKHESSGLCFVEHPGRASGLIQAHDNLVSMNGIEFASLKGGEDEWAQSFLAFKNSARRMHVRRIVRRGVSSSRELSKEGNTNDKRKNAAQGR